MLNVRQLVDQAYEREQGKEKPRTYIGASAVGGSCEAAIAYGFRGYPDTAPEPRLKRIFRDGHRIEETVVYDLKKAGLHVMEVDPMTGEQWTFSSYEGHAIGHADGLIECDGDTILLEIKSMNDSKFKECEKSGVKFSHRHYYGQIQFMLGMAKIEKCLFVAYNKNNSDYLSEEVLFDEFEYENLKSRVETILSGRARKVSQDEADWRCRGCFKFDACWKGKEPEVKSKRTCANAKPSKHGEWVCDKGCQESCTNWTRYEPLAKDSSI